MEASPRMGSTHGEGSSRATGASPTIMASMGMFTGDEGEADGDAGRWMRAAPEAMEAESARKSYRVAWEMGDLVERTDDSPSSLPEEKGEASSPWTRRLRRWR